jgi:hypothetical protein
MARFATINVGKIESDAEWFADHSRRCHRVRPSLPSEPEGSTLVRRGRDGAFSTVFTCLRLVDLAGDEKLLATLFTAFSAAKKEVATAGNAVLPVH